ncbi:flagellum transition zone component, putative [Leishmania tarentolae]|uniref:Flagellum transition zone component, putative n=1 Tax=Leishmania tarentolae TaxID=5689 RepID=A0A640KWX3_LEITA|nr:flagellum transition zone component, putative [Leishmania tarentolae]
MSRMHHLCPAVTEAEELYAHSPLTETEEAAQFAPGGRLLSTTEFKRIYLGGGTGGVAPTTTATGRSISSPPGTFARRARLSSLLTSYVPWDAHAGPSPLAIRAPLKPPINTAGRFHRKGYGQGTACQLRYLYGCAGGGIHARAALETHTSSSRRTTAPGPSLEKHRSHDSKTIPNEVPEDFAPASRPSTHTPLPQQLRSRVRSAARATSPSVKSKFAMKTLPRSETRTEDAWLALTRELMDKKSEVQSLQQQLQHAHVLLRSLHGMTEKTIEGSEDADAVPAAVADTAADVATCSKLIGDSALEVAPSSALPRPKEYWQRRAYFFMKQNEELQAESDRLRRDSRGSQVRALLQELKSVRRQLRQCNRQAAVAAASPPFPKQLESEPGDPEAELGISQCGNGKLASSPPVPRLAYLGGETSSLEPTVDNAFSRQKDDAICMLQERLGLLSQQYERTDARLIATTRQLEDMTHRHRAMEVEWKALVGLPQELARTQQQLAVAQARLLDCDRQVEAFHELFGAQVSPATLRAIIDDRDHLIELLRLSHQSEAASLDEMKATHQQAVRAVEKKFQEKCEEQHSMERDREAQREETIQKLQKKVDTLENVLEVQREAYEGQLAEHAEEREAELTKRLLESLRRPETGTESIGLSAPCSLSTAASARLTLPDKQSPTPHVTQLLAGEASLLPTRTDEPTSLRCSSTEYEQKSSMLRTTSFLESVELPCNVVGVMTATASHPDDALSTDGEAEKPTCLLSDTVDSSSSDDSLTRDSKDDTASTSSASALSSYSFSGSSTVSTTLSHSSERVCSAALGQEQVGNCTASETHNVRVPNASSSSTDNHDDGEGSDSVDEAAESAGGPDSCSSVISSALSSLPPTSGTEGAATQQQRAATNTTADALPKAHSYVIDLPAPPIAVASPVSILINRTSLTGPLFSSHVRAVVHSPDKSRQQIGSDSVDTPHPQPTFPVISETKDRSSSSACYSTSPGSNSPDSGAVDGSTAPADSNQNEPHDGASQRMETDGEAKVNNTNSRTAALTEASTRQVPPLHGSSILEPLATFTSEPPPPPEMEEAVAPAPLTAAPYTDERRSSASLVHPCGTNAQMTLNPKGSAAIGFPAAFTPAVASNLYPQRRGSSFVGTGMYNDDDFGSGGTGISRGGISSRMLSDVHSTNFDLTNQYSGNASFDFVGVLAERHRLEDMQNAFSSQRQPPTATVAIGGDSGDDASEFSIEEYGNTNGEGSAVIGTGAVGLRKTPSPRGSDASDVSKPVLFTSHLDGDEKKTDSPEAVQSASQQGKDSGPCEGNSSTGSMELSHPDDDKGMTSSISAERVTAETREREEEHLADALSNTRATSGSACDRVSGESTSMAKSPVRETTMQSSLTADAARDTSSSSMAIASSNGRGDDLIPTTETLSREEQGILSSDFADVGKGALEVGDVESTAPPAATTITNAAAVPSLLPLPPRVVVPAPPSTSASQS